MRYLKYFEAVKKNPLEDYLWDLLDYGFELEKSGDVNGEFKLIFKGKYNEDEVFDMFKELRSRLKSTMILKNYEIRFFEKLVMIEMRYEVQDISDEIELDSDQKKSLDILNRCVKKAFNLECELIPSTIYPSYVSFNLKFNEPYIRYSWISIFNDGRIHGLHVYKKPHSSGYKKVELPITEEDEKWLTRLMTITNGISNSHNNSYLFNDEYKKLVNSTQLKLRKLYK